MSGNVYKIYMKHKLTLYSNIFQYHFIMFLQVAQEFFKQI